MKRYFVKLSYDGTQYSGWQIQPNAHTVQAELENQLTRLNSGVIIKIMGCGRTDAGVHAKNFFMHMDFPEITDVNNILFKLNNMLPPDIVVHDIFEVSSNAHTRFNATGRTYHYNIHTSKDPFSKRFSYQYFGELNIEQMNQGAKLLLDYDDFEAFSKVKTEVNTFICNVTDANWIETASGYRFTITADRFLRNMVRAIVGTLLEVGSGKLSIDDFEKVILKKSRSNAGKSVPARGLCLVNVNYPPDLIRNSLLKRID